MKLITPLAIPEKDNCDLCRVETNKRREAKNSYSPNDFDP